MKCRLHLLFAATSSLLVLTAIASAAPRTEPTHRLESGRKPGSIDRVRVALEVGGKVKELVENEVRRADLSVACKLTYDERTLDVPKTSSAVARSIRYYDQVEAVTKVAEDGFKPKLRDNRRLIGVEAQGQGLTFFCPNGPLAWDELELIHVLADSLLLDRLLPERPVAVGQTWKHPQELLIAMLGLDDAKEVDVQSKLTAADAKFARIELTGHVEGALGGVSTRIELKGKYRYDFRTKRIDWFGLLVREDRDIGHVQDGLDAIARLQYYIAPQKDAPRLSNAGLRGRPLKSTEELLRLECDAAEGQWQLTYDRCWHIINERSNLTELRMLDRGELLAQCNVSSLPKRRPEKLITLEKFQADIQAALGESFGQFVQARQFANDSDYRVYRVTVHGEVEELPIQWNYYLVADKHGRQAVFAFTVEQPLVERMKKADEKLVAALRFAEPQTASKESNDRR